MATHHRDEFPNLVKLAVLALPCPVQTADCERGFSAQNRILTALRNRLKPLTQKKLLFVKLSTVIPEDALATWKVVKQRDIITCNAPLIFFLVCSVYTRTLKFENSWMMFDLLIFKMTY